MATSTSNVVCDNSTLANFKSWAQFISNAFSSFGWTQTTDTGQVNWSTIASVPSSSYVYEIWKAADSQASTAPIYVKVEYGFNTTSPVVRFTVGTGSDGSGNITGVLLHDRVNGWSAATNTSSTPGNFGATQYPSYASGDSGEIRFLMWRTQGSAIFSWGIERSKDSSGNKTADYVTALDLAPAFNQTNITHGNGTSLAGISVTFTLGVPGTWAPGNMTTFNFNGTTGAFPFFPTIGFLGNPMLGYMSAIGGDVAEGASVTVNIYGANHTFLATKSTTGNWQNIIRGSSGPAVLMRYE